MNRYKRTGRLINHKFYHFLIPTILSTIAMSLNEFVDSIIVSQLLGSEAMTMVNMGSPVMLIFATVFTLLGIGGSMIYAEYMGRQQPENAKKVYSGTCAVSVLATVVIVSAGILFLNPIALSMCRDEALLHDFLPYVRILFASGILIIPVQVIIVFLPSMGEPRINAIVNFTANAVNLLMDYIYIHYFGAGLWGAALATLTGYAVGIPLLFVLSKRHNVKLLPARFNISELKELPEIVFRGAPSALNQLGYCIKIAFCNALAMRIAGISGTGVFALCMQVVSIVSIFIAGIIGAMMPIASALHGQGDFKGIRLLMRTVMIAQLLANAILVFLLEAFPKGVLFIYNINDELASAAITGIRVFSIMFIFRGFVLVFMCYFQIISRKLYAVVISLIDGFIGVIPLSLLLTHFMDINGMWLAFPLLAFLMLSGIIVTNLVISRRSGGCYQGILLFENHERDIPTYDATVALCAKDVTGSAALLQEFCLDKKLGEYISAIVSMASEEIGVYTMDQKENNELDEIDLLVRIYPDSVLMDVRSIGKPFDILSSEEEVYSNIDVLKKIASSVEYSYVTGMNQTRIRIEH